MAKSTDDKWEKIRAKVEQLEGAGVDVGILAAKGGDEQHDEKSGLTLIELAAIHEFGSPAANIPERSFFRRTFIEKEAQIQDMIYRLAKKLVEDTSFPEEQALNMLGAFVSTEIKKTITAGPHIPPPLKPATIEAKGSDRPLVDTGRLVNSITYAVDKGNGTS